MIIIQKIVLYQIFGEFLRNSCSTFCIKSYLSSRPVLSVKIYSTDGQEETVFLRLLWE